MSRIGEQLLQQKRVESLIALDRDLCGAATAEVWMNSALGYIRVSDFRREIINPLLAVGFICTRGGVINLTDAGRLALGQTLDVPALAGLA